MARARSPTSTTARPCPPRTWSAVLRVPAALPAGNTLCLACFLRVYDACIASHRITSHDTASHRTAAHRAHRIAAQRDPEYAGCPPNCAASTLVRSQVVCANCLDVSLFGRRRAFGSADDARHDTLLSWALKKGVGRDEGGREDSALGLSDDGCFTNRMIDVRRRLLDVLGMDRKRVEVRTGPDVVLLVCKPSSWCLVAVVSGTL